MDLLYVGLLLLCFGLTVGLAAVCKKTGGGR